MMKLLLLLATLLFSAQTFACSCIYHYGQGGSKDVQRISKLLGIDDSKTLNITETRIDYAAAAYADPETYMECGCTRFVKVKFNVNYVKEEQVCTALAVKNWWTDRMKVKDINCQ